MLKRVLPLALVGLALSVPAKADWQTATASGPISGGTVLVEKVATADTTAAFCVYGSSSVAAIDQV